MKNILNISLLLFFLQISSDALAEPLNSSYTDFSGHWVGYCNNHLEENDLIIIHNEHYFILSNEETSPAVPIRPYDPKRTKMKMIGDEASLGIRERAYWNKDKTALINEYLAPKATIMENSPHLLEFSYDYSNPTNGYAYFEMTFKLNNAQLTIDYIATSHIEGVSDIVYTDTCFYTKQS